MAEPPQIRIFFIFFFSCAPPHSMQIKYVDFWVNLHQENYKIKCKDTGGNICQTYLLQYIVLTIIHKQVTSHYNTKNMYLFNINWQKNLTHRQTLNSTSLPQLMAHTGPWIFSTTSPDTFLTVNLPAIGVQILHSWCMLPIGFPGGADTSSDCKFKSLDTSAIFLCIYPK